MDFGSLPAWVRTRSRQMGPKPAVVAVGPDGDAAWTWADLWTRVRRQALSLLDSGIDEHEPVVVWADLSLEVLVAELALQAVGCWAIRFPPGAPADRVAEVARRAGAWRLVSRGIPRAERDRVGPLYPALRLADVPATDPPGEAAPGEDPWSEEPRLDTRMSRIGPDALAVAVLAAPDFDPERTRVLTQRNVMGVGRAVGARLGTGEEDAWWIPTPWDGPEAWSAGLGACWTSGGVLVLAPATGDRLQDLWRCHPTVLVAPGEDVRRLAERAAEEVGQARGPAGVLSRYRLRRARGGARPSRAGALLLEAAEALGWAGLRDVLGGRLRHAVLRGGGDADTAAVLRAVGTEPWVLDGPRVAGGALALDPLPRGPGGLHLLDGARLRVAEDGALEVGGVAAVPVIRVSGMPGGPLPPITADSFYRSDWRGLPEGDRLIPDPPGPGL